MRPFIPKDNQNLPDSYSITFWYVNGKTETVEVAAHKNITRIDENSSLAVPFIECVTFDETGEKGDTWFCVPMSSLIKWEFDKRWSHIVAEAEKARKAKDAG